MTMNRSGRHSCGLGLAASLTCDRPPGTMRGSPCGGTYVRVRFAAEASLVSPHERSLFARPGAAARRRSCAGGLQLVERRQHVRGVTLGLHLRPGPGDPAIGVHEERPPRRSHVRLAVVLLLHPRAVRVGDLMILVREQRERQAELLAELALATGTLRTDAPDIRAALMDRVVRVAELAGLDGAAGRVVGRVEVDDGP